MRPYRFIGLASVLAVTFAGQSLVGRTEQAPAGQSARGPFDSLHFRPIGPAAMSGRISDVAVYEANPAVFYVGTAHGGVWKTVNNGTTFEAQLQDQGPMSIGDVAISQSNPDLVWVGTGESSNRQSVSWGHGVFKSTDGGKTYQHMGLRTSRHINRIVVDERDNNVVFVAATGSLWGPGGERGVYKTTDGGATWKQVLKVDDDTGANEVVMDPTDSTILYATTYQRRRTECCFNGGGSGSGFWKSTDGGETWNRLKGGVLDGPLGRTTLDVYRKRPNILYALIEGPAAQGGRGQGGGGRGGQQTLNDEPTGLYRSDDAAETWRKVNNANPRPMYFSQINIDPNDPEVVYLGGVGLHQTLDGGKTIATDVARSTHDDVHAIWINPANSDHVLIGNDGGLAISYDKARTWQFLKNLPVGLFYHVSVDNAVPYNVCGGMQDNYNWCGPSQVRGSAGIANYHWTTLQGGDGFVVIQDPDDFRIAFSESQNGNMVRVDRVTGETMSVRPQPAPGEPNYRWNWDTPISLSAHDPKVVYAAAERVFRSTDRGLSWTAISPDLTDGQSRDDILTMGTKNTEIRFSRNDGITAWPTIVSFSESPKRAGVLYAGTDDGNVQASRDAGRTWTKVTDRIQGIPKGIYVSEVVASRFDEGTVYATFDGHRQNDFGTHVYASNDYGQTWRPIMANLKDEVVRSLTEDHRNPDVLYLATETGLFVSIDRGKGWQQIRANLPTVRIDEIALHPRDNAMILGTHGRAIWVLDNLSPIQEYAAAQTDGADARLFTPPPAAMYRRPARDRNYEFWGDQTFFGENAPQGAVVSWLLKKDAGEVALKMTDASGREVREISGTVLENNNKAGIQFACWDLRVQPAPAPAGRGGQRGGRGGQEAAGGGREGSGREGGRQGGPGGGEQEQNPFGAGCGGGGGGGTAGPFVLPGVYNVALVVDGKTVDTKPLRVNADPEVVLTLTERKKLFDMAMEIHGLQRRAAEIADAFTPFNTRMGEVAKELEGRTDLPPDLKTMFDGINKELTALAPKLVPPAGGRGGRGGRGGGRGGGGADNPLQRASAAKNGMMGGMWPTETTFNAYNNAKTDVPKLFAEANALFTKASALSGALSKHNITLTVPPPVSLR